MIKSLGAQETKSADGKRGVRFLAEVDDLLTNMFIRITVSGITRKIQLKQAYESIISGGETITPEEGYQFFTAFTVENVPDTLAISDFDVSYSSPAEVEE
jgi:hypothetical protein